MSSVITVSHRGKRYGRTVAVDDVSLEVFEGEPLDEPHVGIRA